MTNASTCVVCFLPAVSFAPCCRSACDLCSFNFARVCMAESLSLDALRCAAGCGANVTSHRDFDNYLEALLVPNELGYFKLNCTRSPKYFSRRRFIRCDNCGEDIDMQSDYVSEVALGDTAVVECWACGTSICPFCELTWSEMHIGMSCEGYVALLCDSAQAAFVWEHGMAAKNAEFYFQDKGSVLYPRHEDEICMERTVVDKCQSYLTMMQKTRPCPFCHTLVEKNGGCNHMTCRCRSEWSWTSGGAWNYGDD